MLHGARLGLQEVFLGVQGAHGGAGTKPERCSWIGRACWIFFRKSFVLRSLRASNRPAPRSLLVLHKHLLRNHFPPN
jgi:hypothetical protein